MLEPAPFKQVGLKSKHNLERQGEKKKKGTPNESNILHM